MISLSFDLAVGICIVLYLIYAASFRQQNFETSVFYVMFVARWSVMFVARWSIAGFIIIYRYTLDHRILLLKRKIC